MPAKGFIKDLDKTKHGDLTGRTFGRLHVDGYVGVKYIGKNNKPQHMWKCTCECGNTCVRSTSALVNDDTIKSCGCYQNEIRRANAAKRQADPNSINNRGLRRLYNIYNNIKERCLSVGTRDYPLYGGRGIYVCDEWLGKDGFENFVKWAKDNGYEETLSIDRIDNDGPYAPWNCRWVTQSVQTNNMRVTLHFWDWEEILSVSQFVRKYNLYGERFVSSKLDADWSLDAIIYSAKHQELNVRKVKGTRNAYVNNRGFKVLVPRYFVTAPDDIKKKLLKHEKVRRELLAESGEVKNLKRLNEYSERGHDQFFGEGYEV